MEEKTSKVDIIIGESRNNVVKTLQIVPKGSVAVIVPQGAAVTITENCGKCLYCIHNNPRKSPVCDHPHAKGDRPYADDLDGRDRHVTLDARPTWCPL